MFSVETGLMQQCRDIHAAGIESSNAARFKLISRISCGLQHNVMLLGRRSDLWRRPFSRCHQRTQQLQKKKKKKKAKTNEEGGKHRATHKLVPSPKIKKAEFWHFQDNSAPNLYYCKILSFLLFSKAILLSLIYNNKTSTFIFMANDHSLCHWTESESRLWLARSQGLITCAISHCPQISTQANTKFKGSDEHYNNSSHLNGDYGGM